MDREGVCGAGVQIGRVYAAVIQIGRGRGADYKVWDRLVHLPAVPNMLKVITKRFFFFGFRNKDIYI